MFYLYLLMIPFFIVFQKRQSTKNGQVRGSCEQTKLQMEYLHLQLETLKLNFCQSVVKLPKRVPRYRSRRPVVLIPDPGSPRTVPFPFFFLSVNVRHKVSEQLVSYNLNIHVDYYRFWIKTFYCSKDCEVEDSGV